MFQIDAAAQEHIKKYSGSVTIVLNFEPGSGGCACSSVDVRGSYVPKVLLAEPDVSEREQYQIEMVNDLKVYYGGRLKVKTGCEVIRIKLRKVLFAVWLELEGAQGIADYVV